MELFKSENNWKLYKVDNNLFYLEVPETGEKREISYSEHTALNAFNHAVRTGWTWLKREYYTVSVIKSKVKVNKEKREIRSDKVELFNKTHYLTEAQAKMAINDVMPEALKKFEQCKDAYLKLHKDMDFGSGFNYDGDTHGIYNEYNYISFKMKGFDFQFELD